jgi:hypothetical protein
MIAQTLLDANILRDLAGLEPAGWHSSANVAWELGGPDYGTRSKIKQALDELYRGAEIERMYITHSSRPMVCYKLDPAHLLALAEEAAES